MSRCRSCCSTAKASTWCRRRTRRPLPTPCWHSRTTPHCVSASPVRGTRSSCSTAPWTDSVRPSKPSSKKLWTHKGSPHVSASRLAKIGLKLAAYAVVALAFGYFLHALYSRLDDIPHIHWNARSMAAVVLSVAGTVFTILVTGYLWRALLKDHGVKLRP